MTIHLSGKIEKRILSMKTDQDQKGQCVANLGNHNICVSAISDFFRAPLHLHANKELEELHCAILVSIEDWD